MTTSTPPSSSPRETVLAIYNVKIDGSEFKVEIQPGAGTARTVTVDGKTYQVEVASEGGATRPVAVRPAAAPVAPAPMAAPLAAPAAAGSGSIVAPMPGRVLKLNVAVGDSVKAGDSLIVLEAMKMENAIPAPSDGTVSAIHVSEGQDVAGGEVLADVS